MATKPKQSCGTCYFGRFHSNGSFLCHFNPPVFVVLDNKPQPVVPAVAPDFFGCQHYRFTDEQKALPKAPAKT
jgi:hypothetical protein